MLVSVVFALAGVALGRIILPATGTQDAAGTEPTHSHFVDLLSDDSDLHSASTSPLASKSHPSSRRLATRALVCISLLALITPSLPSWPLSSTLTKAHPSPGSPSDVYPPIIVGCVALPLAPTRDKDAEIERWLHETRVVASRGAKIVSWPEGAVKLKCGRDDERKQGEGFDRMSASEQDLLKRVGDVCDATGVSRLGDF